MDLKTVAMSFRILLCSAWAVSHHSSAHSVLSDHSGKLGECILCYIREEMCGYYELSWWLNVAARLPLSSQVAWWAAEVRTLLSDVSTSTAALPSTTSAVEAGHPCRCSQTHRNTQIHTYNWSEEANEWNAVLFGFCVWLKDGVSLLEPGVVGGEEQDKHGEQGCLPGPPGPQGPEVRPF